MIIFSLGNHIQRVCSIFCAKNWQNYISRGDDIWALLVFLNAFTWSCLIMWCMRWLFLANQQIFLGGIGCALYKNSPEIGLCGLLELSCYFTKNVSFFVNAYFRIVMTNCVHYVVAIFSLQQIFSGCINYFSGVRVSK